MVIPSPCLQLLINIHQCIREVSCAQTDRCIELSQYLCCQRHTGKNIKSHTSCSAAFAIWNGLPSNVRSCETLTTFRRHLKISSFPLSLCLGLVTHLSASDSLSTMALCKFTCIYLLTLISQSLSSAVTRAVNVIFCI